MILIIALVGLILLGGLIIRLWISEGIRFRKSEFDPEINENIQRHPILLNPVILAYVIGLGATIIYIAYYLFSN